MLSDARARSIVIQCLLVAAVIGAATLLVTTTFTNLQMRGIPIGFDFLTTPSRIVISEAILSYKSRDPYYWAIVVGLANTVFISALVIVFSSVLGLIVGVTRLSSNPLAAGTCRVWVEIARNSPPIVLLIFLYSLWWKVLPPVGEALNPIPGVFASMRGVMVPSVHVDMETAGVALIVLAGLFVLVARMAGVLRRLLQHLPGFAPELALCQAAPQRECDSAFAGMLAPGRFQAGEPIRFEPLHALDQPFGDGGPVIRAEGADLFPERTQPQAAVPGVAH